jgi:manganese transport protein
MVIEQAKELFEKDGMLGWKIAVIFFVVLFVILFLAMTFLPIIKKNVARKSSRIHNDTKELSNLNIHTFNSIAVALDFSINDEKLIANALSQGGREAKYILLHIVESASAKYLGKDTDDEETRIDKERLTNYANQLKSLGYTVDAFIGYRNRIKEIVRIVEESKADMLVMGAHHHSGLKDYLFGETIDAVRHQVKIPVLIVNA